VLQPGDWKVARTGRQECLPYAGQRNHLCRSPGGGKHCGYAPRDNGLPCGVVNQMGLFSRDKERERYYLLPGMGGRALQRKQKKSLMWALLVGLVVSVAFAGAIYWLSTLPPS